ncbi:MAG: PKD domain-containing protein [Candidatus Diapherotrites archaeon]
MKKLLLVLFVLLVFLAAEINAQEGHEATCTAADRANLPGAGFCYKWVNGPAKAVLLGTVDSAAAYRQSTVPEFGQVKYFLLPLGLQVRYKCVENEQTTIFTYPGLFNPPLDGTLIASNSPEKEPSVKQMDCKTTYTQGGLNYVADAKAQQDNPGYYTLMCAQDSDCLGGQACNTSYRHPSDISLSPLQWSCIANGAPAFSGALNYPAVVNIGQEAIFSAEWNDTPSSDSVKLIVNDCGAVDCIATFSCDDTDYSTSKPATCSVTPQTEQGITKTLYAFLCDDQGACTPYSENPFSVKVNQAPAPTLEPTQASGESPFTVNFTATCEDSDGTISSCEIAFGDGTSQTLQAIETPQPVSHTYTNMNATAKEYTATLTATDNDSQASTATSTITVWPQGDKPPVAVLQIVPPRNTREFNAALNYNCTDPDTKAEWVLDKCELNYRIFYPSMPDADGNTLNGISGSYIQTYRNYTDLNAARTHTLRAVDKSEASSEDTKTITVEAEPRLKIVLESEPKGYVNRTGYYAGEFGISIPTPYFIIGGSPINFHIENINGKPLISEYTDIEWQWAHGTGDWGWSSGLHDSYGADTNTGFFPPATDADSSCSLASANGTQTMSVTCAGTYFKKLTVKARNKNNSEWAQASFIFLIEYGFGKKPLVEFTPTAQQMKSGIDTIKYDANCARWLGGNNANYESERLSSCEINWLIWPLPPQSIPIVDNNSEFKSEAIALGISAPSPYNNPSGSRIQLLHPGLYAFNYAGKENWWESSISVLPNTNIKPKAKFLNHITSASVNDEVAFEAQCTDYDGPGDMTALPADFCSIDYGNGTTEAMNKVVDPLGDNFDSGILSSEWKTESYCASDSAEINGGKLEFNVKSNCGRLPLGYISSNRVTRLVKDVSGVDENNFDIVAEVIPSIDALMGNAAFQFHQGIILEENSKRFALLEVRRDVDEEEQVIHDRYYFELYDLNVSTSYGTKGQWLGSGKIAFPNNKSTFLKLSKRGSILAAYYSSDGVNYSLLGSIDLWEYTVKTGLPFNINNAGIFFGNTGTSNAKDIKAAFDNLQMDFYSYSATHTYTSAANLQAKVCANDGADEVCDSLNLSVTTAENIKPTETITAPAESDRIKAFDEDITISGSASDSDQGIAKIWWEAISMPLNCSLVNDSEEFPTPQTDAVISSTLNCASDPTAPDLVYNEVVLELHALDGAGEEPQPLESITIKIGKIGENVEITGVTPADPNKTNNTVVFSYYCPLGGCTITGQPQSCVGFCEPPAFTQNIGSAGHGSLLGIFFDSANDFDFKISITGQQLDAAGASYEVNTGTDDQTIHFTASTGTGTGTTYTNDILDVTYASTDKQTYYANGTMNVSFKVKNYDTEAHNQDYEIILRDMRSPQIEFEPVTGTFNFEPGENTVNNAPVVDLAGLGIAKGSYFVVIHVYEVGMGEDTEFAPNNTYDALYAGIVDPLNTVSIPELPLWFAPLLALSAMLIVWFKKKTNA